MDNPSQVILRNTQLLSASTLLVNPPASALAQHFVHRPFIWTWNYAQAQYFSALGLDVQFTIQPQSTDAIAQIILFIPKAKERLYYVVEHCLRLLAIGQPVYLVGEKKAGIEGFAKSLVKYGSLKKIDSARHCQLWQLNATQQPEPKPLAQGLTSYTYLLDTRPIKVLALAGVFSQNKLDIGTQQLLPFLADVPTGDILDFGCGSGIISLVLAQQQPKRQVLAVDIDAFALASTQLGAEHNQLSSQIQTQAVTELHDIEQTFDAIVSNPPFHQGVATDYTVSENLCKTAYARLKPAGELWIVANRFLNYEPLIERYFGHCHTQQIKNGFKVLFAKKSAKLS